jgi:hypothetical protein
MSRRLRIASGILYLVCVATIMVGLVYVLSPTIMPYHEKFLGKSHGQLDPQVAALLLAMMRGAGAIFIALGLGLALLVKGPFAGRDPWTRWAIGILSLGSLLPLLLITLSIGTYTPWWGVGIMIVLVVAALVVSRPGQRQLDDKH